MPIYRERYSDDWEKISLSVREEAGWNCQDCGRPCMRPGEDPLEFVERVAPMTPNHTRHDPWGIEDKAGESYRFKRFVLTTAHLDQRPQNNARENLKALCSCCHLNHDRPFRVHNTYRKREWLGQIPLLPN